MKWNEILLGEDRAAAKAAVHLAAQGLLAKVSPETPITTNELVERIYPADLARGDGIKARSYVFTHLLQAKAREMRGWCGPGEPRPGKGPMRYKTVTPILWHAYVEPAFDIYDLAVKECGVTREQAKKVATFFVRNGGLPSIN